MARSDTVRVELSPTDRRLVQRLVKAWEHIARGNSQKHDTFFDGDDTPFEQTKHDPALMAEGREVPVQPPQGRYDVDAMFHTSTPTGRPTRTL